jgi:hypothetical protein
LEVVAVRHVPVPAQYSTVLLYCFTVHYSVTTVPQYAPENSGPRSESTIGIAWYSVVPVDLFCQLLIEVDPRVRELSFVRKRATSAGTITATVQTSLHVRTDSFRRFT